MQDLKTLRNLKLIVTSGFLMLAAATAGGQTADLRRTAEAAMMKADRDFNQAVADRDMDRFLSLVSENTTFEGVDARGREGVKKAWARYFEPDGPRVSWTPTTAGSLVGGDVGYTTGTWERHLKDARGNPVVRHGEYLTVWKKEKDGVWRAIFDTGSSQPQP